VRVATFNINNINRRLDNLLAWLAKAEPDVVSLQELKTEQGAFPVNALRTLGYEAVWQGERSWNGVAILARNHAPVLTCASLPGNGEDHQARLHRSGCAGSPDHRSIWFLGRKLSGRCRRSVSPAARPRSIGVTEETTPEHFGRLRLANRCGGMCLSPSGQPSSSGRIYSPIADPCLPTVFEPANRLHRCAIRRYLSWAISL
jgi:hypothetical protein